MTLAADPIDTVREALLDGGGVPVAGGTKPALTGALDVSGLRGILEYDPAELTLTALAGTPLREIVTALAEHRQYLPFDPPFVDAGATLGGTVAAGLSGSGSHRHGGLRDFILGVRFLDGTGRLVGGGGKVVKNAAGFDLPKLMVGSLGRLGVLVQVSVKVFPLPEAWGTLRVQASDVRDAVALMGRLATAPFELEALDLDPPGTLLLRLSGPRATLEPRLRALARFIDRPATVEDEAVWHGARELDSASLAKVALTPHALAGLDDALGAFPRRYARGGHLAWVAAPPGELDALLRERGLGGVLLRGSGGPLLGVRRGGAFAARIRAALDPDGRFPEI
ncbi:MAG TPA: FAD-binding protein [Solirubrobacter sp.]|nr:FAD-binding protein [Solirubrobacter sp.]